MFGMGMTEWLIILVIVVILFGGKRIPDLATGLGRAIRGFRQAMREDPPEPRGTASGKPPPTSE
jgi:sec-independent protein translocase protein TatA